ncbi:hypothetical protein [Pacificibacter marinus]|jgi:hypothetical protein|uniref:HIG1 domain-containing protein n=1 Tax=Pacificibacter marinus TaxID=658057 RepID=A0A1Y5T2G5_9RHOB|nr:hypothetical protein [Pacificibacter marinus]SEK99071.1 hypothetical protein SAMN04488032_10998 [Pacificibacter marinus]SLN54386.1 hypothetical protein PAM7971_02789 [Pacificibacter marinus]
MTPELFSLLAMKSIGVAIGVFVGVVIGLNVRARKGNRQNLFRDSVFATAFLASMIAWAFVIIMRAVLG